MSEKTGYKYQKLVRSNSKPVKEYKQKIQESKINNITIQTRKWHIHGNNKYKYDIYSFGTLF